MKESVLHDVAVGHITAKYAYKILYKKKLKIRRAHFVRINITIYDHLWITWLLNLLFLLPFPIGMVNLFLRKGIKEADLEKRALRQYVNMLKYKPIYIWVDNAEVRLRVKTI